MHVSSGLRRRRAMFVAIISAVVSVAATVALSALGPPPARAVTCTPLPSTLPAPGSLPAVSELPDPFRLFDGTRIESPGDWTGCRRAQLRELLQNYEYGHLPPAPTSVTGTRNGNTLTVTVQANGRTAGFNATLRLPSGTGPVPAIILFNGLAASATARGYAEVAINPNDIAADSTSKTGAFWTLYNGTNVDTGVLMAWAWGTHRTLDALRSVPQIDTNRVGISGYSRYGKAAAVTGAFDDRIALTVPGSSGTAGMGEYRFFFTNNTNDEKLEDILGAAYWFTPRFAQFRNQATRLPFDQHSLIALIAPRAMLATGGTEGSDIRTNPQGSGLTHRGAKQVYQFLGVPDRIGIAYRPGGHQIDINDYNAIMDFADKFLRNLPISRTFDNVPYPSPTPAQIPWTAPTGIPPSSTIIGDPPPPPGRCTVRDDMNAWNTGFTSNFTITNTSTTPINGWSLTFTLPAGQVITNGWNATYTPTSGQVTARNVSFNAAIPANGGTVGDFGFQATHTGNTAKPTSFTLNGTPCTIVQGES
jgi:hypothetical protein